MDERLKSLPKWFGYSRRERRSTFILLIILMLVITARFTISVKPGNIEIITDSLLLSQFIYPSFPVQADILADVNTEKKKPVSYTRGTVSRQWNISLNSCDSMTLEHLPFLGPVLSGRIIKYRNLLGGFVAVDQLREVYGLSDSAFSAISGRFFIDSSLVRLLNINKASYVDLLRHPYLEKSDVESIIRYRERKHDIITVKELTDNNIIRSEQARKVLPYLTAGM